MKFSYIYNITTKAIPQIFYRIFLTCSFFLGLLVLLFRFAPVSIKDNVELKGIIFTDQIWKNKVIVTGDVTVLPFVSVVVLPGTQVLFSANQDLCRAGDGDILDEMTKDDPTATKEYARSHISMTVLGNLMALGKKDSKIVFTSSSKNPKETDWNGLIFYGRQASGFLDNCVVSWCHYGPAVHFTDNVYIYNTKVHNCFWSGINAFMCSPVFINNEIIACGHEGFDLHEANPVISGNVIKDSLVGMVINSSRNDKHVIIENNRIVNCANFLCLQDNVKAVIKNNVFMAGKNQMPKKFSYKGFTIPYDTSPMGIEICDNADVVITNNYFTGAMHYSIKYSKVGPNEGINRSTFVGVPFDISGNPVNLVISNNTFENTAALDIPKDILNTVTEDNIFN